MKKPQGYLRRHILAAAVQAVEAGAPMPATHEISRDAGTSKQSVLWTLSRLSQQRKLWIAPDRRVLEVRI